MLSRDVLATLIMVGMAVCGVGAARAQHYPSKPIRIVTTESGSGGDFAARVIAPGISGRLGRQIVVDNRGSLAMQIAAGAAPDGYTLILYGSTLWLLPLMRNNVPWDPVNDFSPIAVVVSAPNILVVHPSLPAKSVMDLIGIARAKPGELNYGSGLAGTVSHLSGELFRVMAGVNVVRIPYKGTGAALNALMGLQVQLMFSAASAAASHVKSGRLRALAVTSAQPSLLVPELPTVAASGVPGYESTLPFAIFAPAKTPAPIISLLNEEIVRALYEPAVKERFFNAGTEVVGSSPEQLAAMRKSDMARWGKVIKDAGIRDE